MKFHELVIGDKFTFDKRTLEKVKEERVSCCSVKCNARDVASGEALVLKPLDEVEKVVVA